MTQGPQFLALPAALPTIDVVVTSLSNHQWDHPVGAAPELARVLRPGGILYVCDFGFAPFDVLTDITRERGLFIGGPPRKTKIRTGDTVLPRYVRQTMTA